MNLSKYILATLLLLMAVEFNAQVLTGFSTKWSDEFTEWDLYTDDEEVVGEVNMTWQFQMDWTKWNFQLEDVRGQIVKPWANDKSNWEVRTFGDIITCRTAWKDDLSEWKITDNDITLVLRTKFSNDPNEWVLRDQNHGFFAIYTTYENDPRDWVILDELDEEVSLSMKMALVFLAIYHSLPID